MDEIDLARDRGGNVVVMVRDDPANEKEVSWLLETGVGVGVSQYLHAKIYPPRKNPGA